MKKNLLEFIDFSLSNTELKNVVGGKMFYCQCDNIVSNNFSSTNQTTANAACEQAGINAGYGSGCTAHAA
ncbi:hypothetical protein GVN16_23275 [Emticicia sp. CRIBPO]|uniref:hypothetical protein n=1 Tax=Emticicia sp. CRIBPO TaxID=2683258 RepID=UPI0014137447|nr:hypothetical protein [Emticicia sp. CRIBPO]NBA88715.1 hypothetical protein [Emticicia sp. CRIBPO]